MPTPSSGNQISFTDLINEFGLPAGKNLGAYRISQNVGTLTNLPLDEGIPQSVSIGSSAIRFSDFYNKRLNIVVNYTGSSSAAQQIRTVLPTQVLTATNLNADINNLNEGVDNFNNIYATNAGASAQTFLRLSLPKPVNATLTPGANLQTFRARVRKNASGGNTSTVRLEVRQNNTLLANSANFTITSTTGENISFTWDASILSSLEGENVEIAIAQQDGGTSIFFPANRRWIEIDAADWVSNVIAFFGGINARQVYNEGVYNVVIGGTQNNISKEYPLDPTQAYKVIFNVNTTLGSRKGVRTNCALRTGDWRTSTGDSLTILKLEIGAAAKIYGAGGDGGSSNDNYANDNVADANPNAAGRNGTSGLGIDYPATVVNRGKIQAGGGGGGAGGGEVYTSGKSNRRSSGGGGGGGAGYQVSFRGLASGTSSGGGNAGSNGQAGTFEAIGVGGAGGVNAGSGGNGGLAANGSPGGNSSDQLGGAGGLAGYAVVISSFAAPLTPPIQNLVDGVIVGDQTVATPT
jgi:hypothetical protein